MPGAVAGRKRLAPGRLASNIPPMGIHAHTDPARRQAKVNRLRRVAGQVEGVARMVAEDRYCIDVLHQIQAVKAALARAESEILRDHAAGCVSEAMSSGDPAERQTKIDELVDLFERAKR